MPSSSSGANKIKQIATIETPPNSVTLPIQIPTVTCDLASDISTSEAAEIEHHPIVLRNGNSGLQQQLSNIKTTITTTSTTTATNIETLKVSTIATARGTLTVPTPPSIAAASLENSNIVVGTATNNLKTLSPNASSPNELRVTSTIINRGRALSVGIDTDMVSEFDPSSSDSGVVSRCAVVKPLKYRLCQPIFGKKAQDKQQQNEVKVSTKILQQQQQHDEQQLYNIESLSKTASDKELASKQVELIEPVIPKVQKPRDPEKEKRRIARKKEKRATLILGLIMGSFIACWLPFFFLYILMPACRSHCNIPDSAFAVAFWLGYMNSALNPAIYTIFNKDFRRAFRRILFK